MINTTHPIIIIHKIQINVQRTIIIIIIIIIILVYFRQRMSIAQFELYTRNTIYYRYEQLK